MYGSIAMYAKCTVTKWPLCPSSSHEVYLTNTDWLLMFSTVIQCYRKTDFAFSFGRYIVFSAIQTYHRVRGASSAHPFTAPHSLFLIPYLSLLTLHSSLLTRHTSLTCPDRFTYSQHGIFQIVSRWIFREMDSLFPYHGGDKILSLTPGDEVEYDWWL
jgi:hypothetical protein